MSMNDTKQSSPWLLVDDDPSLLAVTAKILRLLSGNQVVACNHPRLALEIFLSDPDSFALLVTDIEMPDLNGFALARHLHERCPRLPVLVISGGAYEIADVLRAGCDAFLAKPFGPEELLAAVHKLLGIPGADPQPWTRPRSPGWPRPLTGFSLSMTLASSLPTRI